MPLLSLPAPALLAAQQEPTGVPEGPLREAVVLVLDQAPTFPGLPADLRDARTRNPEVQTRVTRMLAPLEGLLPAASVPTTSGSRLRVPADRIEEAARLLARLHDARYRALEAALLGDLKAWEEAARLRPASSAGAGPPESNLRRRLAPANPARSRGAEAGQPRLNADWGLTDDAAWAANGEARRLKPHEQAELSRQLQGVQASADLDAEYRDRAPALRRHWEDLSAYLREAAYHVATLEDEPEPSGVPALRELKRRARLQFLQRYTANLQLCAAIWSALAR